MAARVRPVIGDLCAMSKGCEAQAREFEASSFRYYDWAEHKIYLKTLRADACLANRRVRQDALIET